jgi:uncharacterized protein YndB with AHSA1/START domain
VLAATALQTHTVHSVVDVCTITQDAFFAAPPSEVFQVFVDARSHGLMSGGERAEIDARVGGRFLVFNGAVSGAFREIVPDRRLGMSWRDCDWPDDHAADLQLLFMSLSGGRSAHVQLTLARVPRDKARQTADAWREHYWVPIAEYLRDAKLRPTRRFLHDFKNRAQLDVVDETWSDDATLHLGGSDLGGGRGPQKNIGRLVFQAFDQVRVEVEDQIVEGDRVVERHRATAVHSREFMGIPATGRQVSWTGNHIYRIANGQIAEAWSEVSLYELLHQLTDRA